MLTLRAGVLPIAAPHGSGPSPDPHEITVSAEHPDAAWRELEEQVPPGWQMMWVTRD